MRYTTQAPNAQQYQTQLSLNQIHGLHPEINRSENQRTREGMHLKTERPSVNLSLSVLIHNHPTRERETWLNLTKIVRLHNLHGSNHIVSTRPHAKLYRPRYCYSNPVCLSYSGIASK